MNDFEALLEAVRNRTKVEKQQIFSEIRDSILIHELENKFNVRAEIILGSILRAPDLTQRGVRGVIAETIFADDILPKLDGWGEEVFEGNLSYDALVKKGNISVRIQVKLQRKAKQKAKTRRGGFYEVEVQRTRKGEKDGKSTRPYKFGEFDLIAVCMEPSTGNWNYFMYAPAKALKPSPKNKDNIKTHQDVPAFGTDDGVWTSDLMTALDRVHDSGSSAGEQGKLL